MNQIPAMETFGRFQKEMLMMPESVRAESLLIHKEMGLLYMRYFRYPGYWNSSKGTHPVGYNHAGIHLLAVLLRNLESHGWRRYSTQVARIGKEVPGCVQVDVQDYGGFKLVDFHGPESPAVRMPILYGPVADPA